MHRPIFIFTIYYLLYLILNMFDNKYPVVMSEIFTEYTFTKATVNTVCILCVYTDCEFRKKTESIA